MKQELKNKDCRANVPNHIAFIMDGNRRWAKARNLPLILGHRKGAGRIEPLVEFAAKRGIQHVTFWAFSSENWCRGKEEIGFLMKVFRDFLKSTVVVRMMKKGVRVNAIGDLSCFPEDITRDVNEIIEKSRENSRITVTFALNYGGRAEVLRAVSSIINQFFINPSAHKKGEQFHALRLSAEKGDQGGLLINESIFGSYLYTKGIPDPDMIVRTGGEQRLSGFLPWQSVYSELYFVDTYWPDFDTREFEKAIEEFARRERRFGQ